METTIQTKEEVATFAGGCFWCMVHPFDQWPGVEHVISGYTGGETVNPTYEEVCSGKTGHYEAVQITFDPSHISYSQLLDIFWHQIDPTDPNGQFADKGESYRTAIFYHNAQQREQAVASKKELEVRVGALFATEILPVKTFYPAEDYHQDFYLKSPDHYQQYRMASGRDFFIAKFWDK